MKQKKTKISLALLFGLSISAIHAQADLTVTGANATGPNGSVSYSIGQIVYTPLTGLNGSIAQGVQQPYEISVATPLFGKSLVEDESEEAPLEEMIQIDLILSVYPNPTSNVLNLKVENYDLRNVSCLLYDMNSKLLDEKKVTDNLTGIDMNNFSTGNYFLKVIDNNLELKTFKIIKN